jgi:hypothetical protein
VTSGTVTVNGIDVRDATLSSLQDCMGMVSRDIHLFHVTARANLFYARPDASDAELLEVLERAQLMSAIAEMPQASTPSWEIEVFGCRGREAAPSRRPRPLEGTLSGHPRRSYCASGLGDRSQAYVANMEMKGHYFDPHHARLSP